MTYNWHYCIASAVYLSVVIFFYAKQRRLPSLRTRLYGLMLGVGLFSLLTDFVAAAVNPYGYLHPSWLLYVINILFLASTQLTPVLFLAYVLILTGVFPKIPKKLHFVLFVPYFVSLIILVLSPFGSFGAFYIDGNGLYCPGATHVLLYVIVGVYVLASVVIIALSSRLIQKKKIVIMYAFIFISVVAMILQFFLSSLLVNTTANALALMMIFLSLESQTQNIDVVTEVFNRLAMRSILQDMYEQNQEFYLILFPMKSVSLVEVSMGVQTADALRSRIAAFLAKEFPKDHILRLKNDTFAILRADENLDGYVLSKTQAEIPDVWDVGGSEYKIPVTAIGINSVDCRDIDEITTLIDYLITNSDSFFGKSCVWVNQEIIQNGILQREIETAVQSAVENNRVEVYFQPIFAKGTPRGLEALARITDEKLGFISPGVFIPIAEKNGLIYQLGLQVFSKTCDFIEKNSLDRLGIKYVSVNLSIIQLMREALSDDIYRERRKHELGGCEVLLEITESGAFTDIPVAQKNIERLSQNGIRFFLDDFGTGYANFTKLNKLPLAAVKLDSSLLWGAMKDERDMTLLSGIISVLQQQNLDVVCEGVETEEQVELLNGFKVVNHQGYYYSRPLPSGRILEFLKIKDKKTA